MSDGLPHDRRGAVTTRRILRSLATLVIIVFLATSANLLFTARYVASDDHKWCAAMTLLTAHPVPRPAHPAANPSREQTWQFYETFVHLRHSLGC